MSDVKRIFIVLLTTLFGVLSVKPQRANDLAGASNKAMGGYSVTHSGVWAAHNNQAGLGFTKQFSIGIYTENRFLLHELSYRVAALVLPTQAGTVGMSVASFGFSQFNESKVGLSYGLRLADHVAAGVQLNYLSTRSGFFNSNSFNGAAGFIAQAAKNLTVGFHVDNPFRVRRTESSQEYLPTTMKLGFGYSFSKKVKLGIETEKELTQQATIKTGLNYRVSEVMSLYGGIATHPFVHSFGLELLLNNFMVAASSSFHAVLGLTPGISIRYVKK